MVDDEIIYYQSKGSTLFQNCGRGFNAVKAVGEVGTYKFEETTAATHELGAKVVNLKQHFPTLHSWKVQRTVFSDLSKEFCKWSY